MNPNHHRACGVVAVRPDIQPQAILIPVHGHSEAISLGAGRHKLAGISRFLPSRVAFGAFEAEFTNGCSSIGNALKDPEVAVFLAQNESLFRGD